MWIERHILIDKVRLQSRQLPQQALLRLLQIGQHRASRADGQRQMGTAKALQRGHLKMTEQAMACVVYGEVARVVGGDMPGQPFQRSSQRREIILVIVEQCSSCGLFRTVVLLLVAVMTLRDRKSV